MKKSFLSGLAIVLLLSMNALYAQVSGNKKLFLLRTKLAIKDSTPVFETFSGEKNYRKGKSDCRFCHNIKTKSDSDGDCYFSKMGATGINFEAQADEFYRVSYLYLSKKGVIDTNNILTGNSNIYIQPYLTAYYTAFIEGKEYVYKLKIRFDILNIYEEVINSVEYEEATEFISMMPKITINVKKIMSNASSAQDKILTENERIREKIIDNFMNSTELSSAKTKQLFTDESLDNNLLMLTLNKTTSNKMSEYVKSVVTIKTENGHGSGCVVSKDGYIITNYHVIAKSKEIKVFNNIIGETKAVVVKISKVNDLALLKIEASDLFTLGFSKEEADFGSEIFAIGTPADLQLGQTLTKGIISGKRKFDDTECYQTDVKINPGSSGGALIDKSGDLIGIVSSKLVGRGIEGIGFGIPWNVVIKSFNLSYAP